MFDLSKDLIEILKDLIRVKSETLNETDICNRLYNTLKNYDGKLVRVKDTIQFSMDFGKDKRVALVGHEDTVPVADSTIDPVEKDGELWGRGACDMKAGVAVMLKIIHEISLGKITPNNNLTFIFYENEEGAIPNGINFLLDEGIMDKIDFAFILEPTEGRYSVGCLGNLAIEKKTLGISAHSANPKKGKNSLREAMEIYNSVESLNEKIGKDQEIDGLKFYETVNVTTLATENRAFNVIPAETNVGINFRFSPEKSLEEAKAELYNVIGSENISIIDEADSCYIGNSGDEFLQPGIEKEIMQAWTDIAQLNNNGIPAINFCAGSILYAHKPEERISIKELNDFYPVMVKHL